MLSQEALKFVKESSLNDKDKESFSYLAEKVSEGKLDEFTERSK